ncbi:hypothetical protein [Mycolicibacterium elephantis]|uniref:hypothetical protein n=1 Tax=Mycolicibacterium elephantis TaxID=81858 RepID=UPI000A67388A|nr:hypothetical protein [Mycolicibacterium elephantis]
MAADWSMRGKYIAKRRMTPGIADEALDDPDAVVLDPDPASKSGVSVRTIGFSLIFDALIDGDHRRGGRQGVGRQRLAVERRRRPQIQGRQERWVNGWSRRSLNPTRSKPPRRIRRIGRCRRT